MGVSLCHRYACGHRSVSGQVTRCVAAVMALPSLRLFPVAVVTILVALVASSEEHEWHFNPGRMSHLCRQQREYQTLTLPHLYVFFL